MPRVTKTKEPKVAGVVKKGAGKKKNQYILPESVPLGDILTDLSKTQWKIGPSIGSGGFGEIYTATKVGTSKKIEDYEYVVKIEPHGNGPLFVEMHFYMRNAKPEDINAFKKKKNLKSFGMPHIFGSGSHDLNEKKHRFIVLPRYGKDINNHFLANGKKLPEHTIYRLAIQMLDVYEYIHGCSYVHGDLKGANMLLGFGKGGSSQTYLLDYGLASHYTTKDFKPDPKKMHNGTIEYTSRDAHYGVPTMRGDFEILGYNLINWSGVQLPWERDNILANPSKVLKAKEEFMANVSENLNKLYQKTVPIPVVQFMTFVKSMEYNDEPNYEKTRKLFLAGLKSLGKSNSGDLDFKLKSTPKPSKKVITKGFNRNESEGDSDDDSAFETNKPKESPFKKAANSTKPVTPVKRKATNSDGTTPTKKHKNAKTESSITSESPINKKKSSQTDSASIATPKGRSTKNTSINAHINISPMVNINRIVNSSAKKRYGNTIINDNLTPNPESKKTYELSLELNVSMDANVIVNVKRKKKDASDDTDTTPVTRAKMKKLNSDTSVSTPSSSSSKIHISSRTKLRK